MKKLSNVLLVLVIVVLVAISFLFYTRYNTVKQVISNKVIVVSADGILQSKDSNSITIKSTDSASITLKLKLCKDVKVEKWFMKSSTGTVQTYTVQKGSIEELKEGDKVHAYLNPSLEVRYIIVFY
ncbi:hypothetical protein [Caldisericum sp. AR60]|uniref:hypothetical protein n=1 Tax=Caldisericum sp. AR60 TaxID=3397852 RepID=UPI0039FD51F9